MAERFRWTRRGYTAQLEKPEVRLLRGLVKDVITLLEGRRADVAEPPGADPAGEEGAPAPDRAADVDPRPGPVGDAEADAGPAAGLDEADAAFWDLVSGLHLSRDREPHRAAPADPAVARLLPDAMPQADAAERGAHRALTEDALSEGKLADARLALELLRSTRVEVPHDQAPGFGRALNDVRLVLAARLGVETDEDAARVHAVDDWRSAEDVESTMALLYNFTTWLLETLMTEMLSELPDGPDRSAPGADEAGDAG
ncbi:DUF2017 family protein [Micrococcus endophyticus]|uniref:DUF2017 family protein n=1 Tax=Micrococcus endophyticus TaxID=455343 RepID=UPI0034CF4D76